MSDQNVKRQFTTDRGYPSGYFPTECHAVPRLSVSTVGPPRADDFTPPGVFGIAEHVDAIAVTAMTAILGGDSRLIESYLPDRNESPEETIEAVGRGVAALAYSVALGMLAARPTADELQEALRKNVTDPGASDEA